MRISEAMTRNVCIARPDQTIQDAARMMVEEDIGIVPVGDNDRLVGMLSDRDIAVRAIAQGKGPDAKVADVMTTDIKYCFEDEDTHQVARNMGDQQIRRIPVVSRDKRLVGILSLCDLAHLQSPELAGEALSDVTRAGGLHTQTAAARM